MKNTLLTIILSIIVTYIANSQTTSEEFTYASVGYKNVEEQALDVKDGYTVKLVYQHFSNDGRKAWLKSLTRKSTGKIAAYIIVYQLQDKPKEYYCIPHPDSQKEILDRFWESTKYSTKSDGDIAAKLRLFLFLVNKGLKW